MTSYILKHTSKVNDSNFNKNNKQKKINNNFVCRYQYAQYQQQLKKIQILRNHLKGKLFNYSLQKISLKIFDYFRYYAFVESPSAVPPKVRPPPYDHVNVECKDQQNSKSYVSVNNICGDLNKGQIPKNPMKQSILGEPYPL